MEIIYKITNYLIVLSLLGYSFFIIYEFLKSRDDLEMLKLSERNRKSEYYKKANKMISINLKKKIDFVSQLPEEQFSKLKKDFHNALDHKKFIELKAKEHILYEINNIELEFIKGGYLCI